MSRIPPRRRPDGIFLRGWCLLRPNESTRASQAASVRQTERTSSRICLRVCSVQGVHTFCCSCFWRTLWTTKPSFLRCWTERWHQVSPYRWVSWHIKKLIPNMHHWSRVWSIGSPEQIFLYCGVWFDLFFVVVEAGLVLWMELPNVSTVSTICFVLESSKEALRTVTRKNSGISLLDLHACFW